jgi:hypothetical protein
MISLINLKTVKTIITLLFILIISYILLNTNVSYTAPVKFNYQDSVEAKILNALDYVVQ